VLGGQLEVPGMAEKAREIRGDQPDQLPAGARVALLRGSKERFDAGGVENPQAAAAAGEKLAMPFTQLDTG
jgi:hypothetical protein